MVLKVYSNLAQAFVNPHTSEGSEQLGQRIWGILQNNGRITAILLLKLRIKSARKQKIQETERFCIH